jgi:hypothetical protein
MFLKLGLMPQPQHWQTQAQIKTTLQILLSIAPENPVMRREEEPGHSSHCAPDSSEKQKT